MDIEKIPGMLPRSALLAFFAVSLVSGATAVPVSYAAAAVHSPAAKAITEDQLETAIADRTQRVREFRFLREEARRLGIRIWLFGGTAAAYGHYVKWDLKREAGDPRYQPHRFDYDYTNIFRSTQDLDIVIDGSAEQAAQLEARLREKFDYLQGSKSAWEVRLLRQARGDKEAILDNRDFLDQNTDSNSTGLIEVSEPPKGESAVRDVRDWNAKERPIFFQDLYEDKLHYYYSPGKHASTPRFRDGRNPPIFSAVRYLTKAFQYDLKIEPTDLAHVAEVVREFRSRDLASPYAKSWLEKNGKKLFQHAVNLDYAARILDQVGLRKLLRDLGDPKAVQSLAWWMSRKPLSSFPVGSGNGPTAKSLELKEVAHETVDYPALESITRAHTGEPNVFVSQTGLIGESAAYGEGFYTAVGRKGAKGTGLTIRFALDPRAREGTDFVRARSKDGSLTGYVLIQNKQAMRVVPESLSLGPVAYFELLGDKNSGLDASDRGIIEKVKRRVSHQVGDLTEREYKKILQVVLREFKRPYFRLDVFKDYLELFPAADHGPVRAAARAWVERVLSAPQGFASVQTAKEFQYVLDAGLCRPDEVRAPIRRWLKARLADRGQRGEFSPGRESLVLAKLDEKMTIADKLAVAAPVEAWFEKRWKVTPSFESDVLRMAARLSAWLSPEWRATNTKRVLGAFRQVMRFEDVVDHFKTGRGGIPTEVSEVLALLRNFSDRPQVGKAMEDFAEESPEKRKVVIRDFWSELDGKENRAMLRKEIRKVIRTAEAQDFDIQWLASVFGKPSSAGMEDLLVQVIRQVARNRNPYSADAHLSDFARFVFSLPHSQGWIDALDELIHLGGPTTLRILAADSFTRPHAAAWESQIVSAVSKVSKDYDFKYYARDTLGKPHTAGMSRALMAAIRASKRVSWQSTTRPGGMMELAYAVFSNDFHARDKAAFSSFILRADKPVLEQLKNETLPSLNGKLDPDWLATLQRAVELDWDGRQALLGDLVRPPAPAPAVGVAPAPACGKRMAALVKKRR